MTGDPFWDTFLDTGEPMSWLLYRAAEKRPPAASGKEGGGEDVPAPSD
jgi:hypothetical protein